MSTPSKPKSATSRISASKINEAVAGALPKGKEFTVRIDDSGIGKMKIVRVITPAWKTLRPAERISKVLDTVHDKLSSTEQKQILRWSVLTREEYERLLGDKVISRR